MNSGQKPLKLLIVSQTFPPDGGIGGRRWAKFAKSLMTKGCHVEIIGAEIADSGFSPWSDDVKSIPIFRYKSRYPKALINRPESVFQKLKYRYALFVSALKAKGTPYDRSLYDEKEFLGLFSRRMDAFSPDFVVISGPPFNLLWYAAKKIKKYPETKFIADLRDPWIGGNFYGYSSLKPASRAHELRKETEVIEAFDLVVTPWPGILTEMKKRFPLSSSKFSLLGHCWDQQDLTARAEDNLWDRDILYGGNLYQGFEPFLHDLAGFAQKYKRRVSIFTSSLLSKPPSNEFFKIQSAIPSEQFFQELSKSKFALFLIPEALKDGFPTKLLEYAACGRPFLAVGYEGKLSQLITERGLGIFVDIKDISFQLEKILSGSITFAPDKEWIDSNELSQVTDRFLILLEKLN